jgi:TetR/AcrR family transcriptional repressor of nem operon
MAAARGTHYFRDVTAGRPKQFRREDVLERAMEHFWRCGYEATSLPELLNAMGISRQSLYDTFGSKRALYLSAIEHYRATRISRALALLGREGSPIENVKAVLRFFPKLSADAGCRGCLVANAMVEVGSRDQEIARLLADTLELLRRGFEGALRKARARGELGPGKSPRHLSRALTTALMGMAVTGRLDRRRAELHGIYSGMLSMLD